VCSKRYLWLDLYFEFAEYADCANFV